MTAARFAPMERLTGEQRAKRLQRLATGDVRVTTSMIAERQAIFYRVAKMATKLATIHTTIVPAARLKGTRQRIDVKAGMANVLASEYADEVVADVRIHGGYGYSDEYETERLSDIQRIIVGRSVLKD